MEDEATPTSFGAVLREHRLASRLTQEALAERAGLGTRGIQDLEHGLHQPHQQTVQRLIRALALSGEARRQFELLAGALPRQRQPVSPIRAFVPQIVGRAVAERGNLPLPPTALIGREREVAAVVALLRDSSHRLVTLTGPGGIGKTRLALQVATESVADFSDGIFFVPLASLTDPELVVSTVARVLGPRVTPNRSALEIVRDAIGVKRRLLVLDNFEPVVEAAPVVVDLLTACPGLKVLVTSRIVLQIQGERVYDVGALAVPDLRSPTTAEQLTQYASVRLFVDRAEGTGGNFARTEETTRAVAEICARVEGLPLAIELAAARTRLLSPRAILTRLSPLLPLLADGARDRPARHQTMRDAIAWSYDVLDEAEKILFRRLAVFVGGFTVDAALAIGATEGSGEVELLNRLESLVGKSLLRCEDVMGEPRLRMLETIREYAGERLVESGDEQETRRRHAAFYLNLAERAEPELWGSHASTVLHSLESEGENLRAALQWCERHNASTGLRLAASLSQFWVRRGPYAEGRRWLKIMLDLAPEHATERAAALLGAGILARDQGDMLAATSFLEESLRLYRAAGDKKGIAFALNFLGLQSENEGDYKQAWLLLEEALAIARENANRSLAGYLLGFLADLARLEGDFAGARTRGEEMLQLFSEDGDPTGIAVALMRLGHLAQSEGDYPTARSYLTDSLALRREIGDPRGIASGLSCLSDLVRLEGDASRAKALLEEALRIMRDVGARESAGALASLGDVARLEGDYARAAVHLQESLALLRIAGDRPGICRSLCLIGLLAVGQGDPGRALRIFAAATANAPRGAALEPTESCLYDAGLADARAALGKEEADRAWAEGQARTLEQAITYSMTDAPDARPR